MAYTLPTATTFKARFTPVFDTVADAVINAVILEASNQVDNTWTEGAYAPAIMYLAAHLLTLEGKGASREAQLAGFKRLRLGSLELERDTGGLYITSIYQTTTYGSRFLQLQRMNVGGPLVLGV